MPLIRRNVLYITVTLLERTQLYASAHNAFIVRPMKKKKSKNEERSNYFVSDVRYSRGCPNKKTKRKNDGSVKFKYSQNIL